MGRVTISFLGTALLAGCFAAEAPSDAQQARAAAVPVKAATPLPPKPVAIGAFKLDAAPVQGGIARGFVPAGTVRLVVDGRDVRIAPDGRFIIGFGRDYATTTLITSFNAQGKSVTERLPVPKRSWRIQSLKNLPHHSQPDAEFQARRPGELAQITAARRVSSDSQGWRQKFKWPSIGPITGVFGSQRIYAGQPGAPHSGVDVAAGLGAPVTAPADGIVILAANSPFTLEGNLLMIDHGMGLNSSFLHLSKIHVQRGDIVKQGQLIGAIGATGRATGPHLHWSLRWAEERLDPQPFVGPMPVKR